MALADRIAMADFFQTSLLHGSPLPRVDALRFEQLSGVTHGDSYYD